MLQHLSHIRIVMVELGSALSRGKSPGGRAVVGSISDMVYELAELLMFKNISFVWTKKFEYFGVYNKTSQTYNGVLGILQRNEADISILPGFGHLANEPITMGPIMFSEKTQLLSRLMFEELSVDVTDFILSLSLPVVALLITSLLFFVTLFTACEPDGPNECEGKDENIDVSNGPQTAQGLGEDPIEPSEDIDVKATPVIERLFKFFDLSIVFEHIRSIQRKQTNEVNELNVPQAEDENVEPNGPRIAAESDTEPSGAPETSGDEATSLSKRLVHFLWHFYCMFLLKPLLQPNSFTGRVLMTFYVIGLLFFSWMWTNNMTSDIISLNTSMNICNLDELIERKDVLPLLIEQDTSTALLLDSNDKRHMALVKRAFIARAASNKKEAHGQRTQTMYIKLINDFMSGKVTIVANGIFLIIGLKAICPYGQTIDEELKVNFGTETFFPAPYTPWYSKRLSPVLKKSMDMSFRRFIESGINHNIMDKAVDAATRVMFPVISLKSCVPENVNDYLDEQKEMLVQQKNSSYTLKAMKGAFYIWISGMSMATMVYLLALRGNQQALTWMEIKLRLKSLASRLSRWLHLTWKPHDVSSASISSHQDLDDGVTCFEGSPQRDQLLDQQISSALVINAKPEKFNDCLPPGALPEVPEPEYR